MHDVRARDLSASGKEVEKESLVIPVALLHLRVEAQPMQTLLESVWRVSRVCIAAQHPEICLETIEKTGSYSELQLWSHNHHI